MDEPPVRLCCLGRHFGPVCADDKVMCQHCFDRFPIAELYVDGDGDRWDVCDPCMRADLARVEVL